MDLNMSLLRLTNPVTLLFTGFHGDKIWDRVHGVMNDQIVRGDASGLGMSEFRLQAGIINCPVPFWGVREAFRVRQITESAEMRPWVLENDYDRPIPRRIVEEAGVPREMFGQKKSATTIDNEVYLPRTRDGLLSFKKYLELRGLRWPSVKTVRWLNLFDMSFAQRFRQRLGVTWPYLHIDIAESAYLTDWAVGLLVAGRYSHALFPEQRGIPPE